MKKYRIITNFDWYEIEWRFKYLPFIWFRYTPSRFRFQPDWGNYKFDTYKGVKEKVKELIQKNKNEKFHVVDYIN